MALIGITAVVASLAVVVHIQKYFINRNSICKRKPVKFYIPVKYIMRICIRHMESFAYRC